MGNYWIECMKEAFEESGINASEGQIENVAAWAEGAHENYSMATGHDVATANYVSDEARELEALKKENEDRRVWEATTRPCRICSTSGLVLDGWGRDRKCDNCGGEGRI